MFVFHAIKEDQIEMDDPVRVSKNAMKAVVGDHQCSSINTWM